MMVPYAFLDACNQTTTTTTSQRFGPNLGRRCIIKTLALTVDGHNLPAHGTVVRHALSVDTDAT